MLRSFLKLLLVLLVGAGLLVLLSTTTRFLPVPGGFLPAFGDLLDPLDGPLRGARLTTLRGRDSLAIPGLEQPVVIVRDERGVPHIFAESDRDAVVAFGYVTAQDRLFQLDFVPRVAAGRLSEILGPDLVSADRHLRATGMAWGAARTVGALLEEDGEEADLTRWYADGVNAYLDTLTPDDLPFEFRLFGYRPERWSPYRSMLLLQYMAHMLSFNTDDDEYGRLRDLMSPSEYAKLFPVDDRYGVPIIPPSTAFPGTPPGTAPGVDTAGFGGIPDPSAYRLFGHYRSGRARLPTIAEGFRPGYGSNNWAVDGSRSATGRPILAGDMHLRLTMPAIWYEAHLVTPNFNAYGVAVPGAPLLVESFTDHLAWAFTNAPVDQIDHYALTLDETGRRYRFENEWRDLRFEPDTIRVAGGADVIDTLVYAHWGPVVAREADRAVAIQWTAHKRSRTLSALWGMHRARTVEEFQEALRGWDTPAQNILVADTQGNIAIRTTGFIPIRASGAAAGLIDGSSEANAWTGRIPFEELPYSSNPTRGYLTSTNQQPVRGAYPYYLGHDWRAVYRSIRIDTLLRRKGRHSVADFKQYQADVHVVQWDLLRPFIDTLAVDRGRGAELKEILRTWNGEARGATPAPLVFNVWLDELERLAWDEFTGEDLRAPRLTSLIYLLTEEPTSEWLDIRRTQLRRETAADLLRLAFEAAADTLDRRYGWDPEAWAWSRHQRVRIDHLLQALRPLGRGPYRYPGFPNTLSPSRSLTTTASASWRVVVDLSEDPPVGWGVYPGGQQGHPAALHYDDGIPTFLRFDYFPLLKPRFPADLEGADAHHTLVLTRDG